MGCEPEPRAEARPLAGSAELVARCGGRAGGGAPVLGRDSGGRALNGDGGVSAGAGGAGAGGGGEVVTDGAAVAAGGADGGA